MDIGSREAHMSSTEGVNNIQDSDSQDAAQLAVSPPAGTVSAAVYGFLDTEISSGRMSIALENILDDISVEGAMNPFREDADPLLSNVPLPDRYSLTESLVEWLLPNVEACQIASWFRS